MKVTFLTVSAGTYANITTDNVELSVRLMNGMRTPARDLVELAEMEDLKAKAATKRAARLRAAADYVRGPVND